MLNRPEPIRQTSLLMVLAAGLGDSYTLLSGLKSLAVESSPPFSNRVTQLRVLLEQGQTLSDALATTTGLLPDETLIAIRAAEDTGTLQQVLADEAHRLASHSETASPIQISLPATLMWGLVIWLIGSALLTFMLITVVPKFKAIFEAFEVDLPNSTTGLVGISDWFVEYWYLSIPPLMTVLALPVWWCTRSYIDYISVGRIMGMEHFPRFWAPLIARLLSLSVAAERPLEQGVHSILKELRPGRASAKLSRVRQGIMSGDDCWRLLHQQGFLKAREVRFLQAADQTGHLDWGLLHLAQAMERRRARWSERLTMVLQPVVILAMGAIVGFVSLALFSPVVKLIHDLSVIMLFS